MITVRNMSENKKYYIGVSILNVYEVQAKNKEQAEEIVRNYSNEELLDDSDFNVNYIDEIKEWVKKIKKQSILVRLVI